MESHTKILDLKEGRKKKEWWTDGTHRREQNDNL